MLEKRDIRPIILYEFKRGYHGALTAKNINKVFGQGFINSATVQKWYRKFRSGNENLDDAPPAKTTSIIDDSVFRQIVEADPSKSLRKLARELNVSRSTILRNMKKIGKTFKENVWVPCESILNDDQETRRLEICSSFILRNRNDPFLDRLVTGSEKWIYYNYNERNDQGMGGVEDTQPKICPEKVLLVVWWSAEGVIHYEFLKDDEKLTPQLYCQQLVRMNENFCQIKPISLYSKRPVLLYDTTKEHVSMLVLKKLNEMKYETLPHCENSRDLIPTDFYFFKHLDNYLKNINFHSDEEIKSAFESFINSRSWDFYSNGINEIVTRWQHCVDSNGSYIE